VRGAFDLGYEFAGGDEVRKSAPISTNRIHKKAPGASRWSEIMKRWNVRVGGWVVAPQQRLRLDEGCGVWAFAAGAANIAYSVGWAAWLRGALISPRSLSSSQIWHRHLHKIKWLWLGERRSSARWQWDDAQNCQADTHGVANYTTQISPLIAWETSRTTILTRECTVRDGKQFTTRA
jgi:hypothetical protein